MNRLLAAAVLAPAFVLAVLGPPARAQPAAASAAADGRQSADAWLALMTARLKRQCDTARTAADLAHTPQERELLADNAELACECLPAQVAAALGPDRAVRLDRAEFLARARTALDTCGARGIRHSIARSCERGFDPTTAASAPSASPDARQQAHCGCVRDGLARMADASLAREAEDAYRQVGERARARAAGASEPTRPPGAIQRLMEACGAQDAPAPAR